MQIPRGARPVEPGFGVVVTQDRKGPAGPPRGARAWLVAVFFSLTTLGPVGARAEASRQAPNDPPSNDAPSIHAKALAHDPSHPSADHVDASPPSTLEAGVDEASAPAAQTAATLAVDAATEPASREAEAPPSAAPPVPPAPASSVSSAAIPDGGSATDKAHQDVDRDPGAPVRLHDRRIFTLHVARGGASAEQRSKAATQALERVAEDKESGEVRVETKGDVAIVYVGVTPILQLGNEDAEAEGDASLSVHAASIAAQIRQGLKTERQRVVIATTVFSFSLLVFSALIAFLLLRKVSELLARARKMITQHPERVPALRVREIELLRPAALRGAIFVALSAGRGIAGIGITYAWVIFALSLFESTRDYTTRLTGFVIVPLSALMGRIVSGLPVLVVATIAFMSVVVAVRFIGIFFGGVARGETPLGWLPAEFAAPASVLVRFGVVVLSLVVAAPLVTGNDDGVLSRAAVVVLVALGLAVTPMLASAAIGVYTVFGRRLNTGEFVEIGPHSGRVQAVTLLEIELADEVGGEIRIPHLLSLVNPTKVLGRWPPARVEIAVTPHTGQGDVYAVLLAAAQKFSSHASVRLVRIDVDGAHYLVQAASKSARSELACALADALGLHGIALGRAGASSR